MFEPFCGQFHESQRSPDKDPFMIWHTGGPGGSSLYGQWAETGFFQVSASGEAVNEYAWNRVANSLFLESPAGAFLTPADRHSGFSYCVKHGVRQQRWWPSCSASPKAIQVGDKVSQGGGSGGLPEQF